MNDPTQYPDKFTPEDLAIAVRNGVAELHIDDTNNATEVRFKGGPAYNALSGEKLAFINNAPVAELDQGDIGSVDGEGYGLVETQETEGAATDETEALDVEQVPDEVQDIPGDEDPDDEAEFDDDADGVNQELFDEDQEEEIDADYLEQLDALAIPPIVTDEDLAAAGLADGPDYTHSEALLSALAAANAASPDFEVEADLAEALYEFGDREKWPVAETFYRHACFLADTEAGTFSDVPQEMRLWFTVFADTGRALHVYAGGRRTIYEGKLKQLCFEIEKTRRNQKLADRKAGKLKKRQQTSKLRARAAEKWRKKAELRQG